MSVRMMTSEDNKGLPNVETVTDYPGHETWRIAHAYQCPNSGNSEFLRELGPGCKAEKFGCRTMSPLYMMTTYEGRVLTTGEWNGYDDSDFYAWVWDDETQAPLKIQYATTRGWTYPNGAKVDADEETCAKFQEWQRAESARLRQLQEEAEAKRPERGKAVKVVRGRKHYGATGRIFWQGVNRFRTYYRNGYNSPDSLHNQRFGIETSTGEKFFVPGDYVEVILPENWAVAA